MALSRILITGGSGFLGKAVTKRLRESCGDKNVFSLSGKAQWDLTNQKHVDYVLQEVKPDCVIHLAAACGGIGINREQPGKFLYDNLSMGMNLIEGCRKYDNLKKFIMVGTVCSYPKHTPVPFKEADIWNGYPEETNAPYGIAKKTLIEMLIAYHNQYGLNSTNLIPVNMYGKWDNFNPHSSHVIPALILKIDKAKSHNLSNVVLWGTGQATREFLYVEDCAKAIEKSMNINTGPQPINIGTCSEIKIADLALMLKDIMGYGGDITYDNNYPDGQPRRCLDVSRAKEVLNFEAETSLREGLEKTVEWYHQNKESILNGYANNF